MAVLARFNRGCAWSLSRGLLKYLNIYNELLVELDVFTLISKKGSRRFDFPFGVAVIVVLAGGL